MSHKRFYAKAAWLWATHLLQHKKDVFSLSGEEYAYFIHRYNLTWLNERSVEIPVIRKMLQQEKGRVLEIGNVWSWYDPACTHTVIDKYEPSSRENYHVEDAETFTLGAPYDFIFSISTLEHVGWDETPRDTGKIQCTVDHIRTLLAPGGRFVFTAPSGYSPPLNEVLDRAEGFTSRLCLHRVSALNEWEETNWDTIKMASFHHPFPFANGLVIATVGPS